MSDKEETEGTPEPKVVQATGHAKLLFRPGMAEPIEENPEATE